MFQLGGRHRSTNKFLAAKKGGKEDSASLKERGGQKSPVSRPYDSREKEKEPKADSEQKKLPRVQMKKGLVQTPTLDWGERNWTRILSEIK